MDKKGLPRAVLFWFEIRNVERGDMEKGLPGGSPFLEFGERRDKDREEGVVKSEEEIGEKQKRLPGGSLFLL